MGSQMFITYAVATEISVFKWLHDLNSIGRGVPQNFEPSFLTCAKERYLILAQQVSRCSYLTAV